MKLKIYEYAKCGTCRNALKFLTARNVDFAVVPIREQPPTRSELKRMLAIYNGDIRRLFNISGQDYRKLKLSTKLSTMKLNDALDLLSRNGNLVKRPFVLTEKCGLVGFNEDQWAHLIEQSV